MPLHDKVQDSPLWNAQLIPSYLPCLLMTIQARSEYFTDILSNRYTWPQDFAIHLSCTWHDWIGQHVNSSTLTTTFLWWNSDGRNPAYFILTMPHRPLAMRWRKSCSSWHTTLMGQLTHHNEQANVPFRLIIQQCLGKQLRTQTSIQLILTLILYLTLQVQDQHPTRHNPMELDTTLLQRETIPNLQGCEPRTKLGKPYWTSKGANLAQNSGNLTKGAELQGCEAVNTSTLHCKAVLGILCTYYVYYISASVECTHGITEGCAYAHDTMWCTCL